MSAETGAYPAAELVRLSDVVPERLDWLSPGRVARGKLTILDGDPGLGKSTMTGDWAASVSRGTPLPDGEPQPPRGVVILGAEDGLGDTIRPRLEAAGADLARIVALTLIKETADDPGRLPGIPADLPHIEAAIAAVDAALLIVDPLMAFLGGDVNAHRDQDVRRALAPLAQLAERTGVAVVLVRHLTKAAGAHALYRGGGSIGIVGAARCGLLLAADPDDPDRRVLASTKSNLAAPPPSLAFRLDGVPGTDVARVAWLGESPHRANALLAAPEEAGDEDERAAEDNAVEALRAILADGPVPAKRGGELLREAGFNAADERRARRKLQARATRHGGIGAEGYWAWSLPGGGDGAGSDGPTGGEEAGATAAPKALRRAPEWLTPLRRLSDPVVALGADPPVNGHHPDPSDEGVAELLRPSWTAGEAGDDAWTR